MIYAWDSDNDRGAPIDEATLALDTNDKSLFYRDESTARSARQRRASGSSSARLEGALLYLQIDISPCLDEQRLDANISCPTSVADVAVDLINTRTYPVSC